MVTMILALTLEMYVHVQCRMCPYYQLAYISCLIFLYCSEPAYVCSFATLPLVASFCYGYDSPFLLQTTMDKLTDGFSEKYDCYLKEFQENPQSSNWTTNDSVAHAYVRFTYDGVWAMAFALENTRMELESNGLNLTLSNFTYFNETPTIGEAIQRYMMKTNFSGVSVSGIHD